MGLRGCGKYTYYGVAGFSIKKSQAEVTALEPHNNILYSYTVCKKPSFPVFYSSCF